CTALACRPTFTVSEPPRTKEPPAMPLYMDVHSIDGGVSAQDDTAAHLANLQTQGKYDVRYLRYWVDEGHGKVFCLVEAPSADAASTVHREAHGLVAAEVCEVDEGA